PLAVAIGQMLHRPDGISGLLRKHAPSMPVTVAMNKRWKGKRRPSSKLRQPPPARGQAALSFSRKREKKQGATSFSRLREKDTETWARKGPSRSWMRAPPPQNAWLTPSLAVNPSGLAVNGSKFWSSRASGGSVSSRL